MRRNDLSTCRPWLARQTRPGHDSSWEVAARPRYGVGAPQAFAVVLSEEDARLIAAAPALLESLNWCLSQLRGFSGDNAYWANVKDCKAVADKATGANLDPIAEDEEQLSRT